MLRFLRRWFLGDDTERDATSVAKAPQVAPEEELVASEMEFTLTDDLIAKLEAARAGRKRDSLEVRLDAFMLDPGLGPATLLNRVGRVFWTKEEFGRRAPTKMDAYGAIRVGAKKTGVAELLALLPPRPSYAIDCLDCESTGSFAVGTHRIVCPYCGGMGWRVDQVRVTPDETAWLTERIERYADETPEERRWLSAAVQKYKAFPLYLGWLEAEAIRPDGGLVRWSTEGEYEGTRPVEDPLARHQMLGLASRECPEVASLAPQRTADDLVCTPCGGRGGVAGYPEVICYCGGLGWVPHELEAYVRRMTAPAGTR